MQEKDKREIREEAKKKAERLLNLDPLKLEANLNIYLYNFAVKILKMYQEKR